MSTRDGRTREFALKMIEWLATKKILFVEQPMPKEQVDDIAWLRERSPLPMIGDESVQRLPDVRKAWGVYDGVNIKLMKCTGMREAYKMMYACPRAGDEGDARLHDRDILRDFRSRADCRRWWTGRIWTARCSSRTTCLTAQRS